MSNDFFLLCHEDRKSIWVGQGWGEMEGFYSGEKDVMQALHRFLRETMGKPIVLVDMGRAPDEWWEYQRYDDLTP